MLLIIVSRATKRGLGQEKRTNGVFVRCTLKGLVLFTPFLKCLVYPYETGVSVQQRNVLFSPEKVFAEVVRRCIAVPSTSKGG